ncbi:hypothetical protein H4R18_004218 [Coemansia javaensis]|uniref:Uncharacterized protein n=1 Tax=Coemansia javaensis TaxID=2761396 RepID=A0A9W8HBF0_9FUNG|nr:hypothetical protein H4R18_004218 [Coemansia javaensis]
MDRVFKVVMVGAPGSGKTSLRSCALHGARAWQHAATATPDFVSTHIEVAGGALAAVQIWDTSGEAGGLVATHSLAEDADAVVLVYAGTSAASLHALARLLPASAAVTGRLRGGGVPVAMVQTMADQPHQAVGRDQALALCRSLLGPRPAVAWMQASARTGAGAADVFRAVAEACIRRYAGASADPPLPAPRPSRHGDPIPYHRLEIEPHSSPAKARLRLRSPQTRIRRGLRRLLCFG